jgi:hypothetical protein
VDENRDDELTFLQQRMRDASLYEACQCIALELRESLMSARASLQLIRDDAVDQQRQHELVINTEIRLAWALQVVNVLFVDEVMKKRLQDDECV